MLTLNWPKMTEDTECRPKKMFKMCSGKFPSAKKKLNMKHQFPNGQC